ncbi:MAG TPA: hypothetical protein VMG10_18765 [Gemmataceae bacterium]|nr:hypothetical protein [Gemmataceae bacterium]
MAKTSKYLQYAANAATRANFLNLCIRAGYTDYVFEFLVTEYTQRPTKPRLIALFEVFCDDSGGMEGGSPCPVNGQEGLSKLIEETDPKSVKAKHDDGGKDKDKAKNDPKQKDKEKKEDEEKKEDGGKTYTLRQLYAKYKSLRRESAEMNIFSRLWTADQRIPPGHIFDHLMPHIFRQEDDTAMNKLAQQASGTKITNVLESSEGVNDHFYRFFQRIWKPAREKLIDAGFDALSCTFSSLKVVVPPPPAPLPQTRHRGVAVTEPTPQPVARQGAQRHLQLPPENKEE